MNDQLRKLYGPLYSLSHATHAAWRAFRQKYKPEGHFVDHTPLTDEQMAAWRDWMAAVFTPMNEAMVKVIVENTDLIEGDDLPPSFLALIAHVEGYRPVIQGWENTGALEGSREVDVSVLKFPAEFKDEVAMTFRELKVRQAKLISATLWKRGSRNRLTNH